METSHDPSTPLEAVWIAVPAGRIESDPDSHHLLDLHATGPVKASIHLAGREHRGALLHGDINILPAGGTGRWLLEAPSNALVLRLAPRVFSAAVAATHVKPAVRELVPEIGMRDAHIEALGWILKEEAAQGYPRGKLWLESAAHALALRLARRSGDSLRWPRTPARALPQWRLRRVCDYIDANLHQDLSLEELATAAGFSVPHFQVLFRHSRGLSVHRYVVERRVERARQLILQGKHSLTEIAGDVGFAHQGHLARCMRRVLGIGPAEMAALYRPTPFTS
jgi:AraC family transcriptional regulator